jgi:hypothetical protein
VNIHSHLFSFFVKGCDHLLQVCPWTPNLIQMTIHGPRVSTSGGVAYEGLNPTTSGGLQSASIVGSTSSSVIYQRGSETYENILPSHERFYDIYRSSQR